MNGQRSWVALIMYALVTALAFRWTESLMLFVLCAGGAVSVLDAFVFRLFHDETQTSGKLLFGAVGALLPAAPLLTGAVAISEAAYLAVVGLLGASLVHSLLCVAGVRRSRRKTAFVAIVIVSGFGLFPVYATLHPVRKAARISPEYLGMRYENVEFRTADGVMIRGWYLESENPRGTAIYCHGYGENRAQSLTVLPTLVGAGLDVLAFDFRGHGESEGHTATFGYREINDVIAAERYCSLRTPGRPLVIVGVSYGAAVAAQSLPQLTQVRAAWLQAPFAKFSNVAEQRFRVIPAVIRTPVLQAYFAAARIDCNIKPTAINPIIAMAGVDIPIMFVHGRQDQLIPFGESELLYDNHTGPKQKLWVDQANHYDLFGVCRDEYLLRLREFVDTHVPTSVTPTRWTNRSDSLALESESIHSPGSQPTGFEQSSALRVASYLSVSVQATIDCLSRRAKNELPCDVSSCVKDQRHSDQRYGQTHESRAGHSNSDAKAVCETTVSVCQ